MDDLSPLLLSRVDKIQYSKVKDTAKDISRYFVDTTIKYRLVAASTRRLQYIQHYRTQSCIHHPTNKKVRAEGRKRQAV